MTVQGLRETQSVPPVTRERLAKSMNTARMADLRKIYEPEDTREAGFEKYLAIGRS